MRRIVTAMAATVTAVVLLFSYHTSSGSESATGTAASVVTASSGGTGSSSSGTSSDSGSSSDSSSSDSGASSSASTSAKTYTGDVAQTRWGAVQVSITVAGGKVTSAQTVQVPSDNFRDQEINAYAVPVLNGEVVDAQSADIDGVSGATVTSDGYKESLQSALDAAHL